MVLNKQDSTLSVIYKNKTPKNYVIDFIPEISDSEYTIYPEGGNSFNIVLKELDINKEDSLYYVQKKFNYYNNYSARKNYSYPIFIKSHSEKIYKFKISNYISGRKIIFDTSNDLFNSFYEDMNRSNSKKNLERLQFLEKQKYDDYEYFTGSFKFIPKEILLP